MAAATAAISFLGASTLAGSFSQSKPTVSTRRSVVSFGRRLSIRANAENKVELKGPAHAGSERSTLKGTENAPLSGITENVPLKQKGQDIKDRMAYICQDCGYIYDQETPFEEVSEDYNCPVCTAPKTRFIVQNTTVGEAEQLGDN
eukprot:jgi/Mesen1/9034/ME000565S08340